MHALLEKIDNIKEKITDQEYIEIVELISKKREKRWIYTITISSIHDDEEDLLDDEEETYIKKVKTIAIKVKSDIDLRLEPGTIIDCDGDTQSLGEDLGVVINSLYKVDHSLSCCIVSQIPNSFFS